MPEFLAENGASILVLLLVVALVGLIIYFSFIRGRRKNGSSRPSGGCSCGCSGCPMSGSCSGHTAEAPLGEGESAEAPEEK